MEEKPKTFVISIDNTKFETHLLKGAIAYHLGPVVIFSYDKEMSKLMKDNMRYLIGLNTNMDFNVPPELDFDKGIIIMAGWGKDTGRYTLNFFNRNGDGALFLGKQDSDKIFGRA